MNVEAAKVLQYMINQMKQNQIFDHLHVNSFMYINQLSIIQFLFLWSFQIKVGFIFE
jgi:hypothetical protein